MKYYSLETPKEQEQLGLIIPTAGGSTITLEKGLGVSAKAEHYSLEPPVLPLGIQEGV